MTLTKRIIRQSKPLPAESVALDIKAMEREKNRIQELLTKNRAAPKYDTRTQSYDSWFAKQGRLIRQLRAADEACDFYSNNIMEM